jgi:hypothetical protein
MIKRLKIFVDSAGSQIRWQSLLAFNTTRLICIRRDKTSINARAVPTDQTLVRAARQNYLEQMTGQTALAETTMSVLRECRIVWHWISQIQFAKPAIRQVDMNFFVKPSLGPDVLKIAQQHHADHQFWINRRTTIGAVIWSEQRAHIRQVEKAISTSNWVLRRHKTLN